MVDIVVQRGLGDRNCDDIVDPFITEVFVAVERGRSELDHFSTEKAEITFDTVFRPNLERGLLIEVIDALEGVTYRAKIVGLNHEIRLSGAITQLTVERVVDF